MRHVVIKKNKFIKLTSGIILSASVPALVSFAGNEDKKDKVDLWMILKIAGVCSTVFGLVAYVIALFNRKSELERLKKEAATAPTKEKRMEKLKELMKKAFKEVKCMCEEEIAKLKIDKENMPLFLKVEEVKKLENEQEEVKKVWNKYAGKIIEKEDIINALNKIASIISEKENVFDYASTLYYFLKFKQITSNLDEKSKDEFKQKYMASQEKIKYGNHKVDKDFEGFLGEFVAAMKDSCIFQAIDGLDVLKEDEKVVSSLSTLKDLRDDKCALPLTERFTIYNLEKIMEGWSCLNRKIGEYKEKISKEMTSLKKTQEQKYSEYKKIKEKCENLSSEVKAAKNKLSPVEILLKAESMAEEELKDLRPEKHTKESFSKKFDSILTSVKELVNYNSHLDAFYAGKAVKALYDKISFYEKAETKYDNLNKNKNFYKPWILSENYD